MPEIQWLSSKNICLEIRFKSSISAMYIHFCFCFYFLQMTLNSTLTVLFYCAHVKVFHYSEFGVLSAIDILACFLQSPAAHTRLLARLVICCLLPILEDCHMTLLELTDASGPLALTLAETVVKQIFNLQDNCISESALCLLWTLCHTPAIVQRLSQIDHLIPELKTMQQTRCSSLAKCVLWKLGYGNYEGMLLAFVAFLIWNKQ